MIAAIPPILERCYKALSDKKADEIQVLDVSEVSSLTHYMIVATATSEPHLRALRIAVEAALEGYIPHVAIDYEPMSGWVVIDAFDVMIHLLVQDKRDFYGIESLWKDGTPIAFSENA